MELMMRMRTMTITKNMRTIRCYSELVSLLSLKERYEYLKLNGFVGDTTFGGHRYLNQMLYQSYRWQQVRDAVIIRDNGYELGVPGYLIRGPITIHHMNPISVDDILHDRDYIYDPEFLISTSSPVHKAIHYGNESLLPKNEIIERCQNDTIPWRR